MNVASLRWRAEQFLNKIGYASGVLMYHRVVNETRDTWNLCVSPENFAEQMAYLREHTEPTDLTALPRQPRWGRPGKIPLAVTFDDGYRDNLLNAVPILERYEIPATIFVVSDMLGRRREFWWDTLERAILDPAVLPCELTLTIAGEERHFLLSSDTACEVCDLTWRPDYDEPRIARHRLFLDLWNAIVVCDPREQDEIVDALCAWAGCEVAPPDMRLPMTPDDLAGLAGHPLITIGGHTSSHASLPDRGGDAQRKEIEDGRKRLELILGRPINRFAYPYGRFDAVAEKIVLDLGFDVACSTRPAPVTPFSRRSSLPRLQVLEGNRDTFAEWLRGWFPTFAA